MSMSLQAPLAADAHAADGQLSHEEQALSNIKSLTHRAGTQRPRAEFETRVNLSKIESIEVMPPYT
jgi:hypothetical protein